MTLKELSREQIFELKQSILCEQRDGDLSMGELLDADNLISDEMVEKEYGAVTFCLQDFWCTAGEDGKCA